MKCLSIANMKATEGEMRLLVEELDQKKQGSIEYEEFLNCCYMSYIYLKEYKLRTILEEQDPAKKGAVSLNTLRKILSSEEFAFPADALDKVFK